MAHKKTREQFIEKSISVHGQKYDYSKVEYSGWHSKVVLVCPTHGDFLIQAARHIFGKGCAACSHAKTGNSKRNTQESFVAKAVQRYGDTYDYSDTHFTSNKDKVDVRCKVHGDFSITAKEHLRGRGCAQCGIDASNVRKRCSQEEFEVRAKSVHGDKYDYSHAVYEGRAKKIRILCNVHGPFIQKAGNHLAGHECPLCADATGYNCMNHGYLYVMTCGSITKVGITNRQVMLRQKSVSKSFGSNFSIFSQFYFEDGKIPRNVETILLRELRATHGQPSGKFDGSTECFYDVDLASLIARIESLTKEQTQALLASQEA